MDNISYTVLTGVKEFKPIQYKVTKKVTKYWYWFYKIEYYLECEYSRLGPFDSVAEILELCSYTDIVPDMQEIK